MAYTEVLIVLEGPQANFNRPWGHMLCVGPKLTRSVRQYFTTKIVYGGSGLSYTFFFDLHFSYHLIDDK